MASERGASPATAGGRLAEATPLENLVPVSGRVTVGDGVYQQLRDALTVGAFAPGQTLTIAAAAGALGTSHMPVREALRRLAAEGALEIRPNGSAHVPAVSRARLDDICRARILLERTATELAADHAAEAELDELARLARAHAEAARAQDIHDMLLRNRDFHFALYRASRSEVLPALIELLWLQYGPYMRMLSARLAPHMGGGGHEPFMQGHSAIVAALRAGKGRRAADEVAEDIRRTQQLLQEELAKGAG